MSMGSSFLYSLQLLLMLLFRKQFLARFVVGRSERGEGVGVGGRRLFASVASCRPITDEESSHWSISRVHSIAISRAIHSAIKRYYECVCAKVKAGWRGRGLRAKGAGHGSAR